MNIEIQARGFPLTRELKRYVTRRVRSAFGNRSESIGRICVRLSDVNGPRGGCDKRCMMQVTLPGQQQVIAESVEPDIYAATYHAADRARGTVARRLDRLRRKVRSRFFPKGELPLQGSSASQSF